MNFSNFNEGTHLRLDRTTIIWSCILCFLTLYEVLQNLYFLFIFRRIRHHMDRVHYLTTIMCIGILVFVTFLYNPLSICILLFGDFLRENIWACKIILTLSKALGLLTPVTVLVVSIWVSLQFMFPFKSKMWTNTSTIRSSYFIVWFLIFLLYGVPSLVDPNIEQCEDPMKFPNRNHALALAYGFCTPCMLLFMLSNAMIYRKAKLLTMRAWQRESEAIQRRKVYHLKCLARVFTLIIVTSAIKLITILAFIHVVVYCKQCSTNNWYSHIITCCCVNLHLIFLPLCLLSNRTTRLLMKRYIIQHQICSKFCCINQTERFNMINLTSGDKNSSDRRIHIKKHIEETPCLTLSVE